jgi:hypothetical protein
MEAPANPDELICPKPLKKGTCINCGQTATITDNLTFHTLTGCVSCDAELVQVEEFRCWSEPLVFDFNRLASALTCRAAAPSGG